MTAESLYELFGKYGAIRQVRLGDAMETRGTAYIIFEDIYDAKQACDHLSGFNFQGRYLIVIYYQPAKMFKKMDQLKQLAEIEAMRERIASEK